MNTSFTQDLLGHTVPTTIKGEQLLPGTETQTHEVEGRHHSKSCSSGGASMSP